MLDNDMIEFLTYRNAMKSNYRKGVHALRCILNNRKQAETFAGSLGGVSLVLGVSQPDGNSEALRALLEGSAVIDQATLTWLKNWWPEQCGSWDTLAADQGRCNAIATDPFLWERVGASPVGAGKILAGLVGQDSRNFAAMQAVATAMQAVASSATAMQAVASSATAMQAVASSATAMQAVASSATAMQAVAVSPVAIAAIYRSDVALSAVDSEVSAAATFYGADSVAMGKAVVILAGLDPAGYADMSAVAASATAMSAVAASATPSAVAASATAMSAVAASATAMSAVAASATAMSAVAASATAMSAVAANYVALVALYSNAEALSIAQGTTVGAAALAGAGSVATGKAAVKLAGLDPDDFADMAAVAASSTAMAAVAASATARSALNGASVARQALKASPLATELSLVSSQGQYWNNPGTKAMKGLILATKAGNSDNAFSITKIDSTSTGAGQNTRNAATSGSTGYLDWYENYPNYAWVMNSITYYAYYTTTKIKYIPC